MTLCSVFNGLGIHAQHLSPFLDGGDFSLTPKRDYRLRKAVKALALVLGADDSPIVLELGQHGGDTAGRDTSGNDGRHTLDDVRNSVQGSAVFFLSSSSISWLMNSTRAASSATAGIASRALKLSRLVGLRVVIVSTSF